MIVAGFGFNSHATADSLRDALNQTGVADDVTLFATPTDKATQEAILDLSQSRRLPIASIDSAKLAAAQTHTQSQISQLARDTGSVAEAAALAGAGPTATLIVTRQISNDRMATCAIAKGSDT